ncbi:MAG: hypothetical protein AAGH73_10895 [Pseudomonadota bacterium]
MEDAQTYTQAQKARIARTSRRSAGREAWLIFSAGGAAIAVALFVLGFPGLLTLKLMTGLPETVLWGAMAFGIAACLAAFHFPRAARVIAAAKCLDVELLYAEERVRRGGPRQGHHDDGPVAP